MQKWTPQNVFIRYSLNWIESFCPSDINLSSIHIQLKFYCNQRLSEKLATNYYTSWIVWASWISLHINRAVTYGPYICHCTYVCVACTHKQVCHHLCETKFQCIRLSMLARQYCSRQKFIWFSCQINLLWLLLHCLTCLTIYLHCPDVKGGFHLIVPPHRLYHLFWRHEVHLTIDWTYSI